MRRGFLFLTLCLLGCTTVDDVSRDDLGAIRDARREFSVAYVDGDTAAIRDLYTENAVLLPPGREIHGLDNIVRYFTSGENRVTLSHAMTSAQLEIEGDLAVDLGTWSSSWRIGDSPEESASEQYLIVWRRGEDARWRIAYDMWHRPPR